MTTIAQMPAEYIEKYRQFVKRNRFILKMCEDTLSRMVIYAPSRFVSHSEEDAGIGNHRKILPETLYAFINLFSLFNDAIYHGFGDGNGLTVGHTTFQNGSDDRNLRVKQFVTTSLRSILSIVECMAPALEVSAYMRASKSTSLSSSSSTKPGIKRRHLQNFAHVNTLSMSANMEKIKFICRLGLLCLQYFEIFQVKGQGIVEDQLTIGILQDGGLLAPNEHVISRKEERNRLKKMLYVGKRTGRKISYCSDDANERERRRIGCDRQCDQMFESSCSKLALVAMGELLHICRPIYYIQSFRRYEMDRSSNPKRNQRRNEKMRMLRTWIISICMDAISYQMIKIGKVIRHPHGKRNVHIDISPDSTREELYRRKMRWTIYMLRAPVWEFFTHPICENTANIVGRVPLVGRPVVQYIMDILMYWQKWQFMQESL